MNKIIIGLIIGLCLIGLSSAGLQAQEKEVMKEYNIKIKVSNRELIATLAGNATTRAFVEKLPVTLPMQDLYGREMCYHFPDALPTDNVSVSGYEVRWKSHATLTPLAKQDCPPLATI